MKKVINFIRDKWPVWVGLSMVLFWIISLLNESKNNEHLLSLISQLAIFSVGIPASAIVFISIHNVVKAKWSQSLLPTWYQISKLLPFASFFFLLLFLISPKIFENVNGTYFNSWFIGLRMIAILAVWNIYYFRFNTIKDDQDRHYKSGIQFILLYLFTSFLLFWDWLIIPFENPENMVIYFEYLVTILLLTIAITTIIYTLQEENNKKILNDLGRYLNLFLFVWLYIIFTEYLINWYAHLEINLKEKPLIIYSISIVLILTLITRRIRIKKIWLRSIGLLVLLLLVYTYLGK